MYIIREVFIAKPGMASKLAKKFKEALDEANMDMRVLTDYIGQFNKVVIETEIDSLEDYENRMNQPDVGEKFAKKMEGYTEMYQTGDREIYRVI